MANTYMKSLKSMARKFLPPKMFAKVHHKARAQAGGLTRAANIKKRKSMQIQSLIFDKKKFSKDQAEKWAKDHNFSHSGVDETENSFRFRQKEPGGFSKMRTIELKPGVKAVVGKCVEKDVNDPPSIQNPQAVMGEPNTEKSQPSSADVHVATTAWEETEKAGEEEEHNPETIEELRASLHSFLDEELASGEHDEKTINDLRAEFDKFLDEEMVEKELPNEEPFGQHVHRLDRPNLTTAEDGEHVHCFILQDGSKVQTEPNGTHVHYLDDANADHIWYGEGGEHRHKITIDGVDMWTEADGKHSHQLLPDTTLEDGIHTHGLVIPSLGLTFSSMPGEYYKLEGGHNVPEDEESKKRQDVRDDGEGAEKGSLFTGTEGEIGTTSQTNLGNSISPDTTEEPFTRHNFKDDGEKSAPLLKIHIGSADKREEGHLGVDTYPHDKATFVHDVAMGLPFPDQSVHTVKMTGMPDHVDPKGLLSEIQRVLMPGGYFHYEGPNEIYNYPEWLVQIGKEKTVSKAEGCEPSPYYQQSFTRLVQPDAATSDDAEPRIGIPNYDQLPSDALLAMDALGYYWSDATSSGRGNRLHGYPSQGALVPEGRDSTSQDPQRPEQAGKSIPKDVVTERGRALVEQGVKKKKKIVDNTGAKGPMSSAPSVASVSTPGGSGSESGSGGAVGKSEFNLNPDDAYNQHIPDTGIVGGTIRDGSDDEKFIFGSMVFDIQKARMMSQLEPNAKVQVSPKWIENTKVDPEHAMKSNSTNPVFIAQIHTHEGVKPLLIDGNHRMYKAVQTGEPEVEAHVFSPEESSSLMTNRISTDRDESNLTKISKIDESRQLVYGVVLEPETVDAQEDWMTSDDIEKAAHHYMKESRVVGGSHTKPINSAYPVESYIAPQDFEMRGGQYGDQTVKKGSWVLGVKIEDPKEWQKVLDGDYQAFSVGGFGQRR